MSMRMSPQAAQTSALPDVQRTSLVFFAGFILILVNFWWMNGTALFTVIFHKGAKSTQFEGFIDVGLQLLGLALLSLLAEYGGDAAGTFSLMFIAALWLLWLVNRGANPAKGSGGGGGGHPTYK